jgi:CHAD domain-containing protein
LINQIRACRAKKVSNTSTDYNEFNQNVHFSGEVFYYLKNSQGKVIVHLSEKMTVSQTFQRIVRHCVARIHANEAGVSVAPKWNPESLHQMRIGIRQLRTALKIFRQVLPFPTKLKQEIKWLDQQLSPARDWDVFSETTLPNLVHILHKAGLDAKHLTPLLKIAIKKAHEEHLLASSVLTGERYAKLMQRLIHWTSGQIKTKSNQKFSLKSFSHDAIQKSQMLLFKRNKKISVVNPKSLHRFRIAAKKCHYAAIFFKSIYSKKKLQKYIIKLNRLQDVLGAHNDMIVADRLLNELQMDHAELAASASFARVFLEARIKSTKLHYHKLSKRISTQF